MSRRTNVAAAHRPGGHNAAKKSHSPKPSDSGAFAVHLLDVGPEEYGDAVLCEFGETTVLIDGAHPGNWKDKGDDHPSIQRQMAEILKQDTPPYRVSLLIVTHAHLDHIGCLPALVEQELIAPEWALVADPDLGWGITPGDATSDVLASQPPPVRQLAAALREEPRKTSSVTELADFVSDAASLEDRYRTMLDQLADKGTRVVRFGPDNKTTLPDLLKEFRNIGLEILGPSIEALVHCAAMNEGRSNRLSDAAHSLLGDEADSADAFTVADAYKRALDGGIDNLSSDEIYAVDALTKDKGSINDESLVTAFRYNGVNLLLTGDMQLSKPEVSDAFVNEYVTKTLRNELTRGAPYALVKLPHHGSYNGFDENVYEALGRPLVVGMCAGSGSKSHPNPKTLEFLSQHRRDIHWARTDHNGLTTFTFEGSEAKIDPTRGRVNDSSPPGEDVLEPGEPRAIAGAGGSSVSTSTEAASGVGQRVSSSTGDVVEVIARIPHVATRVAITVDVTPSGGTPSRIQNRSGSMVEGESTATTSTSERAQASEPFDRAGKTKSSIKIAAGRSIPRLLVLTNRDALSDNISDKDIDTALSALKASGHVVVDSIPTGPGVDQDATGQVKRLLSEHADVRGVLLLGGYDVIHSRRVDSLPTRLRDRFADNNDADNFIVWSDDHYGDREGDALPELPVSRIPDGRSGDLLLTALEAALPASPPGSSGLRNVARPFADEVYAQLPAAAPMLQSRPTVFNPPAPYSLDGQRVYVMLHGSDEDASRFWGEDEGHFPVAMTVENVPHRAGMVAFTGCCWGALPVHTRAKDFVPGNPLGTWTPGLSIALTFLKNGARAFVGCTGSHYSPTRAPYGYFGGPMHDSFWQHYASGRSPAEALFDAKNDYMRNIPHTQATDTLAEAIEFKILREYTCLGLGW